MAVTGGVIGYSRSATVAAGTPIIASWPPSTSVPGLETLKESLGSVGAVWDLSWWPLPHVGVTLSATMTELDLQVAIAKANAGKAARLMWYRGIESNIAFEELAGEMKEALSTAAKEAAETLGSAASSALWFARYGLYIILGIIVLGLIAVILLATRKATK